MKKIETEELKKIQLEILADIHSFCLENDIKYSLAFGSLLGAVRHKGYIPWDDDIDIMIPRNDYEKFISSYGNARYKIASPDTVPAYYLPFAKVYDNKTFLKEDVESSVNLGVNIDVFPLDNVPDSDVDLDCFLRVKSMWNILYNLKIIKRRRERSFFKNFLLLLSHILLFPLPITYISDKMRNVSVKYSKVPSKRIGIIAPSDNNKREIWDKELFKDFTIVPFESLHVQVIKNYHQFLSAAYGEYMQLPPENKRVTHHAFQAYWKE